MTRYLSKFLDVQIKHGGFILDLGLLDKLEAQDLKDKLEEAVFDLNEYIYRDE